MSETLIEKGIKISMDGKGRWVHNKYIERVRRTIKYELVYLNSFDSIAQAKIALEGYIKFYNQRRPHQPLGYKTPDAIYCQIKRKELIGKNYEQELIKQEDGINHSQIQAIFLP